MPLGGLLVGGGLALGSAIFKGIKGARQKRQAKKIDDTRPAYAIPDEVKSNVDQYENLAASNKLPGQNIMEDKLNAGMASDINAVRETGGGGVNQLAAIAGINQNRSSALNDLGVQGAQFKLSALDRLAGARDTMAGYKDQAFDYNKNQEFQYKRMKKNMLQNAGDQNIYGAISDVGSIGGQMMGMGGVGGGKRRSPTYM